MASCRNKLGRKSQGPTKGQKEYLGYLFVVSKVGWSGRSWC